MATKAALRPRKLPQKRRSQATVEAILQAAARLLEKRGYARLTTNHVAAAAGVSIGSLYQYFPSKEAICHALAQAHYRRHAERYFQCLHGVEGLPLGEQVRALVRVGYDVAREDPATAKNLYGELARIGGMDPVLAMRETIGAELTRRFDALPAPLRPKRPEMVAFIVTVACSQLVGDAVMRRPAWLGDEEYLDQVCELVMGYYARLGWA
jgi:AcrR family transcriptional regulator